MTEDRKRSVRAGLVGYGYWGTNIARTAASSPAFDLVAIADGDEEHRARAGRDQPDVSLCASLHELLRDDSLEAVLLATPASTHAALGEEVLASGRHLFVEKPLALSSQDAQRLVTAGVRHGRVVMVGHVFLYSPAVCWLRDSVAEGLFGDVRMVHAQRLLGPTRTDCDVVWDLASHDVSILLHVLEERPVSVAARGYSHLSIPQVDSAMIVFHYESQMEATLHVSWVNPSKVRLFTLVGSTRMVVYDDLPLDRNVTVYEAGLAQADPGYDGGPPLFDQITRGSRLGELATPQLPIVEPLRRELEEFAACCLGDAEPRSDGVFGSEVVSVLEAVEQSIAQSGETVPVEVPVSRGSPGPGS